MMGNGEWGIGNGKEGPLLENDASGSDSAACYAEEDEPLEGVMEEPSDYRSLDVWHRGIRMSKEIYRLTAKFPAEEKFGLTNQMRWAATSIPANLAEGNARQSFADYLRFVTMARGSAAELETFSIIATELEFLSPEDSKEILQEIQILRKQISSLHRALLRRSSNQENKPKC